MRDGWVSASVLDPLFCLFLSFRNILLTINYQTITLINPFGNFKEKCHSKGKFEEEKLEKAANSYQKTELPFRVLL